MAMLEKRRGMSLINTASFQRLINEVESVDGTRPTSMIGWPGGYMDDGFGEVVETKGRPVEVERNVLLEMGGRHGLFAENVDEFIQGQHTFLLVRGAVRNEDPCFLLSPITVPDEYSQLPADSTGQFDGLALVHAYASRIGVLRTPLGADYGPTDTVLRLVQARERHHADRSPWTFEICVAGPHCKNDKKKGCVLGLADHLLESMRRMRGCSGIIECLHPGSGTHVDHDYPVEPFTRGPLMWRSHFTPIHVDHETAQHDTVKKKVLLWAVGYVSGPDAGVPAKELIFFPPPAAASATSESGRSRRNGDPAVATWLGVKHSSPGYFNWSQKALEQDSKKTNLFVSPHKEWLAEKDAPEHVLVTLNVGDFYVIPPGWAHTLRDVPGSTANTCVTVGFTVVGLEAGARATAPGCNLCEGSGAGSSVGFCPHEAGAATPGVAVQEPQKKKRKKSEKKSRSEEH